MNDEEIPSIASLIAIQMENMQIDIMMNMIKDSGLWFEFEEFCLNKNSPDMWSLVLDFCSQYPDKFTSPPNEHYENFVIIDRSSE